MQHQQSNPQSSPQSHTHPFIIKKPKDPLTLSLLILLPLLLFLSLSSTSSSSSSSSSSLFPLRSLSHHHHHRPQPSSLPSPPSLAYLLSASSGDARRLLRLLRSLYHPRNLYLLHLDLAAEQEERAGLALKVRADRLFRSVGNVHVIGRADFAYRGGSSALAAVLHGAALMLRIGKDWDWFVNLDTRDYPLVTQDDLLHVFSFIPRDLNFVQHSGHIGWRESHKLKPIIVDPGLYLSSSAEIFYATQKRDFPNAFRLFTGSPSVILGRKFMEHCILGTDNLPRILLMYYANTPSSHTTYFQTLLCNSPEFNRTIINNHLHYVKWDTPPKLDPHMLNLKDFNNMTQSGLAFATGSSRDGTKVLDRIDREVLNRDPNSVIPGGWCLGGGRGDPCSIVGPTDVLKPGPGAMRLAKSMVQMLSNGSYRSNRCIWDQSL